MWSLSVRSLVFSKSCQNSYFSFEYFSYPMCHCGQAYVLLIPNRWFLTSFLLFSAPYVFRFTSLGEIFPRYLGLFSSGKYQILITLVFWWRCCPYVWYSICVDIGPNFPHLPLPLSLSLRRRMITITMISNHQTTSSLQNLGLSNDYTILMFVYCTHRQPFLITLMTKVK